MKTCVFCQIIKGKIPAQIVYQNDKVLAFLDNQPKTAGHTLVVPKKHFVNIFDIPEDMLAEVVGVTQKIAQKINQNLQPQGLNICQNNGAVAGQSVDHLHFHIIPRYQHSPKIEKNNLPAIYKKLV